MDNDIFPSGMTSEGRLEHYKLNPAWLPPCGTVEGVQDSMEFILSSLRRGEDVFLCPTRQAWWVDGISPINGLHESIGIDEPLTGTGTYLGIPRG